MNRLSYRPYGEIGVIIMKTAKTILVACVVAILVWLYVNLHEYANTTRMGNGLGGEILVFMLPVIVWVVYRNIKDAK